MGWKLLFLYLEIDILCIRVVADDVRLDLFSDAFDGGSFRAVFNIDGDQQDEVVVADIHRTDIVYMPDSSMPVNDGSDFSAHVP